MYVHKLSWQIESLGHLSHFFLAHTIRLKSHALGIDVDLRTLREHVNLVEGIHYIQALGKDAVLLPHHYIIVFQFLQGFLSQLQAAWQLIRNDAQTEWTECLGFRNHAPKQIAQNVLAHELLVVAHGDKLDRVSMNGSLIVGTLLDETGMNAQVTRQL